MTRSSTSIPPSERSSDCRAILLVEDDEAFRAALADVLRDDGHDVLDYRDPQQVPPLPSLACVAALVIGDRPPSSDGLAFADRFHSAIPGAPVVMCAAYVTLFLEFQLTARPYINLLRKPMDYAALSRLLEPESAGGAAATPGE